MPTIEIIDDEDADYSSFVGGAKIQHKNQRNKGGVSGMDQDSRYMTTPDIKANDSNFPSNTSIHSDLVSNDPALDGWLPSYLLYSNCCQFLIV